MSVSSKKAYYKKLPVPVVAYQWHGHNPNEPEDTVVRYYRNPNNTGTNVCHQCNTIMHNHGWIDTLEGGHIVCPSDYIIRGVKGEMYPCKEIIFLETYKLDSEIPELKEYSTDESFDK